MEIYIPCNVQAGLVFAPVHASSMVMISCWLCFRVCCDSAAKWCAVIYSLKAGFINNHRALPIAGASQHEGPLCESSCRLRHVLRPCGFHMNTCTVLLHYLYCWCPILTYKSVYDLNNNELFSHSNSYHALIGQLLGISESCSSIFYLSVFQRGSASFTSLESGSANTS